MPKAAGWMLRPVQRTSRLQPRTRPGPQQLAHSAASPRARPALLRATARRAVSPLCAALSDVLLPLLAQMKRVCDITGKSANNANRVTFSNKKNARLQHVNLQKKNFFSPELNRNVKLKVATSTMRTITKLGLDETAKKYGVDLSKF